MSSIYLAGGFDNGDLEIRFTFNYYTIFFKKYKKKRQSSSWSFNDLDSFNLSYRYNLY